MPEPGILPSPESFLKILSDLLLGRAVKVIKGKPLPSPPPGAFVFAVYKSAAGNEAIVCACDLPLAAAAGAALSLIPAGVVGESVRAGKLSDTLEENIHEIFNVCSGLFNHPERPHLALQQVILPPGKLEAALAARMAKPSERFDFEISIDGYGAGKFSSWVLA